MKKRSDIILLLLFFSTYLSAQPTAQEQKNLTAFAKIFGYVCYFHPSDEAQKMWWSRFAITGSKKVIEAKNDKELLQTLEHFFKPIAPSAKFFLTSENVKFSVNEIIPPNVQSFNPIYWQHLGMYTFSNQSAYASIRVNRKS